MTKNYCCISDSYYITITFFFLYTRSFLWPRICRKLHFRPGLRPGLHWGSLRRFPDPIVGWGGDTPPRLHPTRRRRLDPRASGARVCPLHIISGYATVYVNIRTRYFRHIRLNPTRQCNRPMYISALATHDISKDTTMLLLTGDRRFYVQLGRNHGR